MTDLTSAGATSAAPDEAHMVADHPALDMLNTGGDMPDGRAFEYWRDDADVLRWLSRTAWPVDRKRTAFAPGELVSAARELRESVRGLVTSRKEGRAADPEPLNRFLRKAVSYPRLIWHAQAGPEVVRETDATGAARALLPLAEAAAELLTQGDFALVRQCEHPECVYWFYDRTKSHRRRWCSMALCGNRYKVAQFRKRQSDA
jgi:predicted RNA-binding Zn ribbon-like protein